MFQTNTSHRYAYLGVAAILAFVFEWFVWPHSAGLGLLAFTAVYTISFILLTAATKRLTQPLGVLLFVPALLFALSGGLYHNELVVGFSPVFTLIMALIASGVSTSNNPKKVPFALRSMPVLVDPDIVANKFPRIFRDLFSSEKSQHPKVKQAAYGALIAIPFLLLFGALFYAADEVFANWVKSVIELDIELLFTVLRFFVVAFVFGGFFYAYADPTIEMKAVTITPSKAQAIVFGMVFGLINLLFLVFVIFQFRQFFGGEAYLIENGLTYAEYARRGFFEMLVILFISGLMLLVTYRSFHRAAEYPLWLRILQALLSVQVGVVAFSALTKLYAYQDAYGFTVSRLYGEWGIYMVLALLVLGIAGVMSNFDWRRFWQASMVVGLGTLLTVSLINVDGVIAERNIERFESDPELELDVDYLLTLSVDTLPPLITFVNNNPEMFGDLQVYEISVRQKDISDEWQEQKIFNQVSRINIGEGLFDFESVTEKLDKYKMVEKNLLKQNYCYTTNINYDLIADESISPKLCKTIVIDEKPHVVMVYSRGDGMLSVGLLAETDNELVLTTSKNIGPSRHSVQYPIIATSSDGLELSTLYSEYTLNDDGQVLYLNARTLTLTTYTLVNKETGYEFVPTVEQL